MQRASSQFYLADSSISKLYQHYWQTLFIRIRRTIPAREDAEDILLEVFLAAVESKTFQQMSEAHQKAWLRRVAYNKCMDFHRNKARYPTASLEEYIEILYDFEHLAPEQLVLRQEGLTQLREHLTRLSTDQREILRLRFVEGLRCTQIAGRTDKSAGAVRVVLARALNRLRGIYAQHGKRTTMAKHDEPLLAEQLDHLLAQVDSHSFELAEQDLRLVKDLQALHTDGTPSGEGVEL